MFDTENLRKIADISNTLYEMQRREICEEKTQIAACFKSAVFPVVRLRVAFQPRNVFSEFPIELSSNVVKEITGVVEYPGVHENTPTVLSFNNFYLTANRTTVIAESTETVPSIIRTKTEAKSEIEDGKTRKEFIQGFPKDVDDDFTLPETSFDRLLQVTIRWRSKSEKLDFRRCLTTFYYHPATPGHVNRQLRMERDGMAVRVREAACASRAAICAYFLPTLHNEVKLKITSTRRGWLEVGWSDPEMRRVTSVNLLTGQITPASMRNYRFGEAALRLEKNDMITIKRVNFKEHGKTATDGIAISRARRATDERGMPYIFLCAIELGEENFDGLTLWLRDPGDCLAVVE